jgi:hypothetical protein
MMIYGNMVCFFTFTRNNLVWIRIEDVQVRTSQFSMFKLWWEVARKLQINEKYKDMII